MDLTVPGTPSKKMQRSILVEKMNVAWIAAQYGCNTVALPTHFGHCHLVANAQILIL